MLLSPPGTVAVVDMGSECPSDWEIQQLGEASNMRHRCGTLASESLGLA